MLEAALWGFVGGSSLLIGALLAVYVPFVRHNVGVIMGFGAGVLISAVAYELIGEAFHTAHGSTRVAIGFAVGSLVYFFGDLALSRHGGDSGDESGEGSAGAARSIVLGTILDGIPESIVIGVSLIGGGGGSVAVVAAVFLSNVPEAVAATKLLDDGGMARSKIYLLWSGIALLTTVASAAGYGLLQDAPETAIAFVQAFAGGAVLTMLASAMMPEAFELGGKLTGLSTSLGFAVAVAITAVG